MARAGGNPNIANERKTGQVTDEGKLKMVLATKKATGFGYPNETPLLKRIRQCNKCPLGEKLITMRVGDKIIKRTKPAECGFYEAGKTECVVPVTEWVEKVKIYHKFSEELGTFDLHRAVILEAFKNSTTAGEIETIKKGHPAFYAKEWMEMGLKYLTEYNRMTSNQAVNKHQHLHMHEQKGDLAERIVNKIFPEEEKEE